MRAVRSRKAAWAMAATTVGAMCSGSAEAATWTLAGGGTWGTNANWSPATFPNAIDEVAVFNNAASAANAAQTANRTIALTAARTIGTLTLNNDAANAFTTGIQTSGSFVMDVSSGSAAIDVPAAVGTGNFTITRSIALNDPLNLNVNNVTASSASGALNLDSPIVDGSGSFGVTKNGDGTVTFSTNTKAYTGATVLNGGRMRLFNSGMTTGTSSFTINPGGQLELRNAGPVALGTGTFTISGTGPSSGPSAAFPGALRPASNLAIEITNDTVLAGTVAQVVSAGTPASSSITFSGDVSGTATLLLDSSGAGNSGTVAFTGTNSYVGGSTVNQGTLQAGATSVNAFGTGNVSVNNVNGAASQLTVQSGAVNAIDDNAILSLAGGGVANTPDLAFASLLYDSASTDLTDIVGGLILGGVPQTAPGEYGATGSGATYIFDDYFSGPGTVTLVPEPTSLALLGLGGLGLLRRRRA